MRSSRDEERRFDAAMLDRMRAGDEDAFGAVFRAHYAALVGFADGMLHDRDAAEEVVQDVMVEMWRRRDELTIATTLRAYLHRAVRNRALNQIRHERVVVAAAPMLAASAAEVIATDARAVQSEMEAALARGLEALPPRCRAVYELSRVQGLRYSEIAEALDISVKTVEAQMGKALRILREHMAAWLPSPAGPNDLQP